MIRIVCPNCRKPEFAPGRCANCGERFSVDCGIWDFSGGRYYDQFNPETDLNPQLIAGWEQEVTGIQHRTKEFYAPLLREREIPGRNPAVLDVGCGNGLSVDILRTEGFDAWGADLSQARKWQWSERRWPERLVVASALRLPFEDVSFDAILASGVLEHIGVTEVRDPSYRVTPLPSLPTDRALFITEMLRVLRPEGRLFIDAPNGAFPIDFWHGNRAGGMRWHSPYEQFLPGIHEIESLVAAACPGSYVRVRSPRGRLQFHQVGQWWYGRALRRAAGGLFALFDQPFGRWLAATPLNPFLVVEIGKNHP